MNNLTLIQNKHPILLHENYLRNILFLRAFVQLVKNNPDESISYNYSAILKFIPSSLDCDECLFFQSVQKLAQSHLRLCADFSAYDFVACVNETINPVIQSFETDNLIRATFCKVALDMLDCDVMLPVLQKLNSDNTGYIDFLESCYAGNSLEVDDVLKSMDNFLNIQ